MPRQVTTVIDEDACMGCAECIKVCPSDTISIINGKAVVTGEKSLGCGHCAAVCPENAIRVMALENNTLIFKTIPQSDKWRCFGDFDASELLGLMMSRRSCRNYLEKPVPKDILEDLVRMGVTAPSGTNSQKWTFTILDKKENVMALGEKIGIFFRKTNNLAQKAWLRKFLKLIGKNELENYFHEYFETVKNALKRYDENREDLLFHGASAVIIIGSQKGASCPCEDALLATQNILLGAHALGLGTCLIGFAATAMKKDKSIKKFLKIPEHEDIYSVIALGYPDEQYLKPAGRKAFVMRYPHKFTQ